MEEKLWTYTYQKNAKALIDHLLMNKKWMISALNWDAYSSFERLSSDRRIVTTKLLMSLHRNKAQKNCSSLNNRDVSNKYTVTVRNKFETAKTTIVTTLAKRYVITFNEEKL